MCRKKETEKIEAEVKVNKKEIEVDKEEEVEKKIETEYLTSGSLSKTKDVSLSHVKLKSTFGAVLFLLLTVM